MQVTAPTYFRFAKSVGALVTLMGVFTLGLFVTFVLTGTNALAAQLPSVDGLGLLLFGSFGAFALPLGASLFSADAATSTRLRIAGGALGLLAILRLLAYAHPELRATLGVAPLVEFFVLGSIALVASSVRPKDEAAVEMHFDFPMDAPASAAWVVLGEAFGDVADWTSTLRASSLDGPVEVGSTRTCEVEAFGPFAPRRLTEELIEFDERSMRFTYIARSGLPPVIRAAKNRWSVEHTAEGRCRARSHISIDLVWWAAPLAPLMRWSMRSGITEVGRELRDRVEGGVPPALEVEAKNWG